MPNYLFKCGNCDEKFEEVLLLSECDTIPKCPKCKKSTKVEKVFSPVPIKFLGAGFNRTYRG